MTPSKAASIAPAIPSSTPSPTPKTVEGLEIWSNSKNHKKKPNKPASIVWDHFTRLKNCNPNNPRCICNYCGKDYACNSKTCGTNSMLVHLQTQCKKYPFRVVDKKQKVLCFQPTTETRGESNLVAMSYCKEACQETLSKMVILDELPFGFVEGEGFKHFCLKLQPRFDPPSRVTIARDILQLFQTERNKLKGELTRSSQRVSLTIDC